MREAKLPLRNKQNMKNYDQVTSLDDAFVRFMENKEKMEGEVCILSCWLLKHDPTQKITCSYCHRDVFTSCDKIIDDTPIDKRKCHDCTLINVST